MSAFYAAQSGPFLHITGWRPDTKKNAAFFRGLLFKTTSCPECGVWMPMLFRPDAGRTIEIVRLQCPDCGAFVEMEAGSGVDGWSTASRQLIDRMNRRYQLIVGVYQ